MNNEESTMKKAGSGTGGFFLGLMTGVILGGIAVMLYAPKSGLETRGLLREEVNRTQEMLQSWADDLRARANEISQIIRFGGEPQKVSGNGQQQVD
jgi:gas vesicle protein